MVRTDKGQLQRLDQYDNHRFGWMAKLGRLIHIMVLVLMHHRTQIQQLIQQFMVCFPHRRAQIFLQQWHIEYRRVEPYHSKIRDDEPYLRQSSNTGGTVTLSLYVNGKEKKSLTLETSRQKVGNWEQPEEIAVSRGDMIRVVTKCNGNPSKPSVHVTPIITYVDKSCSRYRSTDSTGRCNSIRGDTDRSKDYLDSIYR